MIECDVLVVGAGPAGSVVALYCSKHGLNTVLIEKNKKVGAHTKTRIDASPDFELTKIINELELKIENVAYISKWHSPSGRSFTLNSKIGEYYFKRGPDSDSFERSTVEKAVKNGCKLFLNTAIEKIDKKGRKFHKAIATRGGEEIVIKPKIIIAADGSDSFFHKYLNEKIKKEIRVGYGVTGKNFGESSTSEVYFDAELAPGGYFYVVTCPSGISSAAIILNRAKIEKSPKKYFDNFFSKNQKLADRIKLITNTFAGEAFIFKLSNHVHGNLLLAGDAGGLANHFMGYGVMPAIVSAYYAAKWSAEAINKNDFSKLQKYDKDMKKRFDKPSDLLYSKIFNSLDNQGIDLIIKMANELKKEIDIDAFMHDF
ncbi:MAG: NAD(P)/FAD-dependent oxidoreductase [Candidatus Hydrothermarchaeota archaeon]|nr:NAD(P)/FAD-dependent oxidoreductase [Candidatus Hydrothermarchaeota archaeon]